MIAYISIATLNTRGLDKKIGFIREKMDKNNLSILCIQETHKKTIKYIEKMKKQLNSDIYVSPGTNKSRGAMIIIKRGHGIQVKEDSWQDDDGNGIAMVVEHNDTRFGIANVYAPNAEKPRENFMSNLPNNLDEYEEWLVGGDWNSVENRLMDTNRSDNKPVHIKQSQVVTKFKTETNLHDVYRERNPNGRMYTFRGLNNYKGRLDRIYASDGLLQKVTDEITDTAIFSDHDLYGITIKTAIDDDNNGEEPERKKKRSSPWKYNSKILEDPAKKKELEKIWEEWRQRKREYTDKMLWWDHGKNKLISALKRMGKERKQTQEIERNRLHDLLEEKLRREQNGENLNTEIRDLKNQLRTFEQQKEDAVLIRTKTDWREKGEQSTRYFFNLEKQQQEKRQIKCLLTQKGDEVHGQENVENTALDFYKDLYSKKELIEEDTQEVLNHIKTKLNDEDREKMEVFVSSEEIRKHTCSFSNNKSPGLDGLTAEFYKQCNSFLGSDLAELINNIILSGEMPDSMRYGLVTLIYKEKGCEKDLKYWRPITLLNVDYKIMTKALNSRITPALNKLISTDQSCGISGRKIYDQLITLQETYDYMIEKRIPGILAALDLEKAYDLIDHEYMMLALEKYNFPPFILNWIKSIYGEMFSKIIINGKVTESFALTRSIRQGDPLSAALFVLMIEPMAEMLRKSSIAAVKLPNTGAKITFQYADDTSVLAGKGEDYHTIMDVVGIFERGAGARLNKQKTEILVVGDVDNLNVRGIPEANLRTAIKVLGMWIGEGAEARNYNMMLRKFNKTIETWEKRYMAIEGKLLIVRSCLMTPLYHIMRIHQFTDQHVKIFENKIRDFLWHPGNMCNVSFAVLQNKIEDGGRNVPNIKLEQEALLVERITELTKESNEKKPWSGIATYRLGFPLRAIHPIFRTGVRTMTTNKPNAQIIETAKKLKDWSWEKSTFAKLKNALYMKTPLTNIDCTTEADQELWKKRWVAIKTSSKCRKRYDINYLTAHGKLAIGELWHQRRSNLPNNCTLCNQQRIETRQHIFLECNIIEEILRKLKQLTSLQQPSFEQIVFHHQLQNSKQSEIVSIYKDSILKIRKRRVNKELIGVTETKQALLQTFYRKIRMEEILQRW